MLRYVDLATLQALFRSDKARMQAWLLLYMEEAPKIFGELEKALQRGDVDALAFAAHELRPHAHYLGAPQLLESLVALGEQAHKGDARSCSRHVADALLLGQAVEDEVRAVLATW